MIGDGGSGPEQPTISRRDFLKKGVALLGAIGIAATHTENVFAQSSESLSQEEFFGCYKQSFAQGERPRNAADAAFKESLMADKNLQATEQEAEAGQGDWALRPDIVIGLPYVNESGEAKMNVYFGQAFVESGHADDTEYFPQGGVVLMTSHPEKGLMKITTEAHKQKSEIMFYQMGRKSDGSYGVMELSETQIPSAMQRHYLELGR